MPKLKLSEAMPQLKMIAALNGLKLHRADDYSNAVKILKSQQN